MKKTIALLMAVILCLCFTGCSKEQVPEQSSSQINSEEIQNNESQNDESQTESTTNTENEPKKLIYLQLSTYDYVESEMTIIKNDDNYSVEMDLYRVGPLSGTAVKIGDVLEFTDTTKGVQGTIKYDDTHAVFEVTNSSSETFSVGDKFEFSDVAFDKITYVDRQGSVDKVFSEIIIRKRSNDYLVEIGLYRLTTLTGTAVMNGDVLEYTDTTLDVQDTDVQGTIKYDDTHAVFEVTQSTWELLEVGQKFEFSEKL